LRPIVLTFLREYLQIWNGQNNVDNILGLLSYLPTEPFTDLYSAYLSAVERVLIARGISSSAKLISLYTSLLQTRISLISYESSRRRQSISTSSERQMLRDLAAHVSTLSTSLLLSLPPDSGRAVVSSILSFYELLSASSKPHVIPIILPPMHLVYHLTQSTSSTVLSRICGIISNHKAAFDEHPKPVRDYYAADVTETLNWCLRDIYNLFWVSRGLVTTDQKAAGLYCNPSVRAALNAYLTAIEREYAIGYAFGLSHNTWLASMSAAAWRTLEEQEIQKEGYDRSSIKWHKGPVTQQSLAVLRNGGVRVDWDGARGYKAYVLKWLAERGLGGIRDLMFATVTDLRSAQTARPK
jgi:centromere protein I